MQSEIQLIWILRESKCPSELESLSNKPLLFCLSFSLFLLFLAQNSHSIARLNKSSSANCWRRHFYIPVSKLEAEVPASLGTIQKICIGEQIAIQARVRREHEPPRYDTVSGRPSRIQPLKWPILKQNPSTFGWDMTQNGNKMFWVISQPNIDGFCFNMGHFKGWILLDRPDTVSYRKQSTNANTIQNQNRRIVWLVAILGADTS